MSHTTPFWKYYPWFFKAIIPLPLNSHFFGETVGEKITSISQATVTLFFLNMVYVGLYYSEPEEVAQQLYTLTALPNDLG